MSEQPAREEQRKRTTDQLLDPEKKQQIRKSQVRVYVTYFMTGTYVRTSTVLVVWLMVLNKPELAIGVFSGVASTSASIIAFWFGSRGSASEPPRAPDGARQPEDTQP